MNTEKMVHMANQIAKFFAPYGRDKAIEGVCDHLRKFWEPRMRQQIVAHVAGGGDGLDDIVREAVRRLT